MDEISEILNKMTMKYDQKLDDFNQNQYQASGKEKKRYDLSQAKIKQLQEDDEEDIVDMDYLLKREEDPHSQNWDDNCHSSHNQKSSNQKMDFSNSQKKHQQQKQYFYDEDQIMSEMNQDLNLRLDKDEDVLKFDKNILNVKNYDGINDSSKMLSSSKKKNTDHSRKPSYILEDPLNFINAINQIKNDQNDFNDLEQLDNLLEQLQIDIIALGFPDCGNLRSTKRKDVKMRVRVLQAMVKQRKKDLEFRNQFQDKFSKQDVDFDALKDKAKGLESKIHLVEKEKQNLKNIMKEKDDEIRQIKEQQKSINKNKAANHTQIEQKLVKSECELKKASKQIIKLQDQLKRQMGINSGSQYTAMKLEIKDKIVDYPDSNATQIENSEIIKELKLMISEGFKKETMYLKEENRVLKQNILTLQEMLKKIVDDSLVSLQGVLKNNEMLQEFNDIVKSFKITNTISQMQLNVPQLPASSAHILTVLKDNIIKLKQFSNTILNPSTIAELVLKLGTLKKQNLQQKYQSQIQNGMFMQGKNEVNHMMRDQNTKESLLNQNHNEKQSILNIEFQRGKSKPRGLWANRDRSISPIKQNQTFEQQSKQF